MSEQPKYETRVIEYKNSKALNKGTQQMAEEGWTVVSIQSVDQGYSGSKTCCLGCLFLPLALLGKKPDLRQVLYQREVRTKTEEPEEDSPADNRKSPYA